MNKPFLPLVLSIILGIIIAYYLEFSVAIVFMLLFVFMGIFIYSIVFERAIPFIMFFLFFAIGILVTISNKSGIEEHLDNRIDCIGVVDQVIRTNSADGRYVIIINSINKTSTKKEKMVLKVISRKDLELGETISFNGILKKPMENTNPKLYNHRLNLLSEKIYTTMTIRDYQVSRIESERHFKYMVKSTFTRDVEGLFNTYLSEENSALITSIILGESSYIAEDNLILYRDLGLAHILAVSGLHIGIISGFLIFIFSRLGIKRRINITLTLAIIWFYGFLIGYPPSILRASIMFSLLFYSTVVHEPYDSINTLSFACFILLLINPYYLFHIGFQLSFMAAFSIVFFTPHIKALIYPNANKLWSNIAALLAVHLGLFPIQSYYFNKIGLLSIFANLILVPLFSISLIFGFLMVLISYTFSFINIFLGSILNMILSLQYYILNRIPLLTIKIFSPDLVLIVIYYLILIIVLKIIDIGKFPKVLVKIIIGYLILLISINSLTIINDKSMELHFIDVGQGDSILIRTKYDDYLMDTGGSIMASSFDIPKSITLPYLEKLGIRRLKAIIITHFHEDHAQGLPLLIDNLKVDNIISSYTPKGNQFPLIVLGQGDEIILDENTRLSIIWPDSTLSSNENNMSLVTLLSYYNSKILFTGDMEKEVEMLIGDKLNKIDIIKVPHHGSNTSSTEDLLNILMPDVGIIQVGRNNLYNHPSKDVVSRYENINTKVFRTDNNGLIKIHLNKGNYSVNTYINEDSMEIGGYIVGHIFTICYILFYYLLSYILIKIYLGRKGVELVEL